MIINGIEIAADIIAELKKQPKPQKFLAAILVGEDPASVIFLKEKEKVAGGLGVDFRLYKHPASLTRDELRKEVLKIAQHKTCGGVIVQLPLPEHLNKHYAVNVIPREKDVDVLGERALGAFYTGRNPVLPPAVGVVQEILSEVKCQMSDVKAAVIGRGFLVGKPISVWLIDKVAELEVFASDTKDLKNKLKNADIVISGVGKLGLFGPEDLKECAGVIDFGYSTDKNGNLRGDFDTQLSVTNYQLLRFYTETPGGTGPILVAKLFENFYELNKNR